jgi:hypothetical protein
VSKAKDVTILLETLHSDNFNADSDKWFGKLVDLNKNEKVPAELTKLANDIKKGALKPTEKGFEKFSKIVNASLPGVLLSGLRWQIENIRKGKYSREFKNIFGDTSQVSELFSLFKQAALYHDYMR